MLGYVTVNKSELSEEEFDIYRGYYCGVCKSIAERHGHIARIVLSYDSVFLAMILASLNEMPDSLVRENCIAHPIKLNPVLKGDSTLDYAADMLILLAYFNFLDDISDEHKLRGTAGEIALRKSYIGIEEKYPDIANHVQEKLNDIHVLERAKSEELDKVTNCFGEILGEIFSGYYPYEKTNRVLRGIGISLGKWIYLMDALDDLEEDKKNGTYNPLIYRERGTEGLEDLLFNYLGEITRAVDLLDIRKNKGIIDNIIWFGLRARTEVLIKSKGR